MPPRMPKKSKKTVQAAREAAATAVNGGSDASVAVSEADTKSDLSPAAPDSKVTSNTGKDSAIPSGSTDETPLSETPSRPPSSTPSQSSSRPTATSKPTSTNTIAAASPLTAHTLTLHRHPFSRFYAQQYNSDRWRSLLPALLAPTRYSCLVNRHADPRDVIARMEAFRPGMARDARRVEWLGGGVNCVVVDADEVGVEVLEASEALKALDGAQEGSADVVDVVESETAEPEPEPETAPATPDTESGKKPKQRKGKGGVLKPSKQPTAKKEKKPAQNTVSTTTAAPRPADLPFPPPAFDVRNVRTHYLMDLASVVATDALALRPNDRVLDLCAAPGGKSLCILQTLNADRGGRLTANEMSVARRTRLKRVLREYLPRDTHDRVVTVTGVDGTRAAGLLGRECFDKVLCDAPCSSERHVVRDAAELEAWSAGRTRAAARRQRRLLAAALACVRDGGRVVYATCSLSEEENDRVVERVVGRGEVECEVLTGQRAGCLQWPVGEPTRVGWMVLPDRVGRWGPLYFAVLVRKGMKAGGGDDEEDDADADDTLLGEEAEDAFDPNA
ncbi:NOL1/NOP2/Sun domain member 3 [Phlyctochytrium bullatum]|nr:NOL1/NOP2/Sun domain member 3 [Phlyctochytrium bullatum]